MSIDIVRSKHGYLPKQGLYSPDLEKDACGVGFVAKINGERSYQSVVNSVANTFLMENEANGLADSFVARHTTDPTLRLELLLRNQNGSHHDQVTEVGAEISGPSNIATDSPATVPPPTAVFPTNSQATSLFPFLRPWSIESLESTSDSPLALVQGVARATVQMNRVMQQREQRELERPEQLRTEIMEAEIGMRRGRGSMISREVDLIDRMDSLSFIEQQVDGASTSVTRRIEALANGSESHQFPGVEPCVNGFLPQVRSRSNVLVQSTVNPLLELEQRAKDAYAMVQRALREREREEFGREIERKEHEIRAERARKKREREEGELPEVSMWPHQHFPVLLCNFNEHREEAR